ncbi:hypothetical protein TB2_038156 [Malus domestica]
MSPDTRLAISLPKLRGNAAEAICRLFLPTSDDHNGSLCMNGTAKQFLDSGAPPATTNNLSKSRRTFDQGGGGSDVGDGREGTDETVEDVKEEAAKREAEDQAEI